MDLHALHLLALKLLLITLLLLQVVVVVVVVCAVVVYVVVVVVVCVGFRNFRIAEREAMMMPVIYFRQRRTETERQNCQEYGEFA